LLRRWLKHFSKDRVVGRVADGPEVDAARALAWKYCLPSCIAPPLPNIAGFQPQLFDFVDKVPDLCRDSRVCLLSAEFARISTGTMFGAVTYSLEDNNAGGTRLAVAGQMLVSSVGAFETEIEALSHNFTEIEISGVDEMDTIGALVVSRLASQHDCPVNGASETARHLLDAVGGAGGNGELRPPRVPVW